MSTIFDAKFTHDADANYPFEMVLRIDACDRIIDAMDAIIRTGPAELIDDARREGTKAQNVLHEIDWTMNMIDKARLMEIEP